MYASWLARFTGANNGPERDCGAGHGDRCVADPGGMIPGPGAVFSSPRKPVERAEGPPPTTVKPAGELAFWIGARERAPHPGALHGDR